MLVEEQLTYQLRGTLINVSKRYGAGHKERVYQQVCAEAFRQAGIPHVEHPQVRIHSLDSGKVVAVHIPDFLITDRIVLELKSVPVCTPQMVEQLVAYLRATVYEVGILVNFGTPVAQIVRRIYTNDRKPWMALIVTKEKHP